VPWAFLASSARPPAFAADIPDISVFLAPCAGMILETFFLAEDPRSIRTRIFQDL